MFITTWWKGAILKLVVISDTMAKGELRYVMNGYMIFKAFYSWAMTNGYSSSLSIDRINVDGNYCPENCRWVTMEIQNGNKRNTIYVTFNDKVCTLKELSEVYAIKYMTLYHWYRGGNLKERLKAVIKHDGLL